MHPDYERRLDFLKYGLLDDGIQLLSFTVDRTFLDHFHGVNLAIILPCNLENFAKLASTNNLAYFEILQPYSFGVV